MEKKRWIFSVPALFLCVILLGGCAGKSGENPHGGIPWQLSDCQPSYRIGTNAVYVSAVLDYYGELSVLCAALEEEEYTTLLSSRRLSRLQQEIYRLSATVPSESLREIYDRAFETVSLVRRYNACHVRVGICRGRWTLYGGRGVSTADYTAVLSSVKQMKTLLCGEDGER